MKHVHFIETYIRTHLEATEDLTLPANSSVYYNTTTIRYKNLTSPPCSSIITSCHVKLSCQANNNLFFSHLLIFIDRNISNFPKRRKKLPVHHFLTISIYSIILNLHHFVSKLETARKTTFRTLAIFRVFQASLPRSLSVGNGLYPSKISLNLL